MFRRLITAAMLAAISTVGHAQDTVVQKAHQCLFSMENDVLEAQLGRFPDDERSEQVRKCATSATGALKDSKQRELFSRAYERYKLAVASPRGRLLDEFELAGADFRASTQ